MQTAEPFSTREATKILVKILDSTYAKWDLEQVDANATHIESEQRTQLLRLLNHFEVMFDVTLWDWDIEPVYLALSPDYKPSNCNYYPVPRINKETFRK